MHRLLKVFPAGRSGPAPAPTLASMILLTALLAGAPCAAVSYQWHAITDNAAWTPRDGAGALVFQNKMWLLGGWNPYDPAHFPMITNNEVWSSMDGVDWTLEKANTFTAGVFDPESDWEGRHTAGYVVFNDKMWIVGGDANQGHYQNDVWNSSDGRKWTHVNVGQPVPWGPRALHYTLVHDNKIWVIGGQTMPAFAGGEERFYRDVWNTTDGVHWQQLQPEEPFWPQRGMIGGSVVFQGRMWILGGGTYDTPQAPQRRFFNDVWSSADGVHWTQHTANAPWASRQYHDIAVFDGRMWVCEGYDGSGNRRDVWYSDDGAHWTEVPNTPWNPRHAASVFVLGDALWMVAGNNMQQDVWKLTRPGPPQGLPITFEPSIYAPGPVVSQDGWSVPQGFTGNGVDVIDASTISGAQSLRISPRGEIPAAASHLFDAPDNLSWKVRVDSVAGPGADLEMGFLSNLSSGATPLTVVFGGNRQLQYYNGSANVNLPNAGVYTVGRAYRVDVSHIDEGNRTYDVGITDTGTGTVAASGTGLPIFSPLINLRFSVLLRSSSSAACGVIDDIVMTTPLGVAPEREPAGSLTAYPNPASPSARLEFTVPRGGHYRLTIYDAAGRRVRLLLDRELSPGLGSVAWDGRDDRGASLAGGVCTYVLDGPDGRRRARKTVVLQ